MADRRRIRAPLLDRLLDDNPGGPPERPPFRVLSRHKFAQSVVRDLSALLNTRTTARVISPDKKRDHTHTVLDYGLEDFTHLSPASNEDRETLRKAITQAITLYEPRLEVHKITVSPIEGHHRNAMISCEVWLIADDVREPVSFRINLNTSESTVQVDGR